MAVHFESYDPSGAGGGFGGWWNSLSPETKSAIYSAAISGGGALASGMAESAENDENRALSREELAQRQKQFEAELAQRQKEALTNALQTSNQQGLTGRANAAQMSGSSPLQFQMDRNRAYLQGQFLNGNMRPSITAPAGVQMGTVSLPNINSPFLTPEALSLAEAPYWQNQRALNPDLPDVDLTQLGYGSAGAGASQNIAAFGAEEQARSASRQKALMDALGVTSGTSSNAGTGPLTAEERADALGNRTRAGLMSNSEPLRRTASGNSDMSGLGGTNAPAGATDWRGIGNGLLTGGGQFGDAARMLGAGVLGGPIASLGMQGTTELLRQQQRRRAAQAETDRGQHE